MKWYSELFFTCKFCVKDLFILLPDLLLVIFEQALTEVAHLPQCERRLVLPWGTCETQNQISFKKKKKKKKKGRLTKLSCAMISHLDKSVLSPEIGARPGAHLQLLFSVVPELCRANAALTLPPFSDSHQCVHFSTAGAAVTEAIHYPVVYKICYVLATLKCF